VVADSLPALREERAVTPSPEAQAVETLRKLTALQNSTIPDVLEAALEERMTRENGRALIEEANRWQKAYARARDELAERDEQLAARLDLLHDAQREVKERDERIARLERELFGTGRALANADERIAELERKLPSEEELTFLLAAADRAEAEVARLRLGYQQVISIEGISGPEAVTIACAALANDESGEA
jgi:septal ring factor EnvC (AmiA/AmiB activator)